MKSSKIGILLVLLAAMAQILVLPPVQAQSATAKSAKSAKVSPVAPRKQQVQAIVQEAYNKYRSDTRGKNADYIPVLAQVNPALFGIAVVSVDNQVVTVGDINTAFSIQPIAWTRSSRRSARSRPVDPSIPQSRWPTCRRTPATHW